MVSNVREGDKAQIRHARATGNGSQFDLRMNATFFLSPEAADISR